MIEVKFCPGCRSLVREEILQQKYPDIYLELIDPNLNKLERRYFRCQNCELIYRSPKLSEDEQVTLYKRYRENSFRNETPDEYFDRITRYNNDNSENFNKLNWLKTELSIRNVPMPLRILDVGCGGGVLLHKYREMWPEAITYGVEPNEHYSNLARRRSGASSIVCGYFDKTSFLEKFSMVLSSDVLEHVDDPIDFLNSIYLSLEPGGCIFLEVPSQKNFFNLPHDHDMFNIAHHVFFSEMNLKELLSISGYQNPIFNTHQYNSGVYKLRAIAFKP